MGPSRSSVRAILIHELGHYFGLGDEDMIYRGRRIIPRAMSRALAYHEHDDTPNTDHFVRFHNVTWEDYEHMLEMRGDKSAPRIHYLEGELEIMSPSVDHERIKSFIGCLLEAWCADHGIEYSPLGSWTLKEENEERGAEADECYVFGTEPRDRPHLAIEVEWTRGGINKLRIYEKLGVDEVWIWRKGVIQVHIFAGGKFVRAQRSRLFPALDLAILASVLDRNTASQAIRDFREALARES